MNTLQKQAGRMLTIGFEGQECGAELKELLRMVQPGGVIFFQRNIATEQQFRDLVSEVRAALGASQCVLAIDQEGGEVDRFREVMGPLPSAQDAARAGLARELGDLAGRELAAFGLNVDFAPVVDLASSQSRSVLGTRTAGETPQEVVRFAERFLLGLEGWNVAGCLKHFPGLGSGLRDSHVGMPVIEKTEEALWTEDLLPFRALGEGRHLVMVAHAWYPELEGALAPESAAARNPTPASLSPNIVTGLLRERIGAKGPIVCDDLEMGGALEGRTIEEAAVQAAHAGCDILLVCRHAANVERVHRALVLEAERDSGFRGRVQQEMRVPGTAKQPAALSFADTAILRRDIRIFAEEVRLRLAMQERASDAEPVES
jgi:beta-N-acetylhexosaminidase